VLIQGDTGNYAYVAGVWVYDIDGGDLARIARHDPDRFGIGGRAGRGRAAARFIRRSSPPSTLAA
jgi:hypothetical protein